MGGVHSEIPVKVLVTGVAGFLGSHVAQALIDKDHEVGGIDDLSLGVKENVPGGVSFDIADVLDGIPPDYDAVFHAAGISRTGMSITNPAQTLLTNIDGTVAVLESLKGTDTRLVYASSAVVIEPHSSPYAASKAAAENIVHTYQDTYNLNAVSLRYASVYGPGQSELGDSLNVLAAMKRDRAELGYVRVEGDGSHVRDFIHVTDAGQITVEALEGGNHKNVATGIETSILEAAKLFDCPIRFVPGRTGDPKSLPQLGTPRLDRYGEFRDFVLPEKGIREYAQ